MAVVLTEQILTIIPPVLFIPGTLKIINLMEPVKWFEQIVIVIKVNIKMVKRMGMAFTIFILEQHT